jgi:hypothetical protein
MSGFAFFRGCHTGSARRRAGLFEPDLRNIGSHHVAGDVCMHIRCDAGVVITPRRAHMPTKMAVVVPMVKDSRHSRAGSSKKAEDHRRYRSSLFHCF